MMRPSPLLLQAQPSLLLALPSCCYAGTTLAAQNLDGKRPRDLTLDSSKATRAFALEWHTLDAGLKVVCGEAAPQPQLAAEGAE